MASRGLAVLGLLGGCVLTPVWGDEPTRRDPIDFTGMASKSSAQIRIQARNHGTGVFENLVVPFAGTSTRFASAPDLYGWGRIGVLIPDRYWVLPGAPCASSGMADVRVQEQNSDGTWSNLATFDAAGKECLDEHLAAGDHPAGAGAACKRPDASIVLFAPPQCAIARTTDATPATVTVRLSNATSAWQRTSGQSDLTVGPLSRTAPLLAHAMTRDLDNVAWSINLVIDTTVTCRRASDGAVTTVPDHVALGNTEPFTPGALGEIGLDGRYTIDVPRHVASCPSGYAFQRLDGVLQAIGGNATRFPVRAPRLGFWL